jgi:hypothetical protein
LWLSSTDNGRERGGEEAASSLFYRRGQRGLRGDLVFRTLLVNRVVAARGGAVFLFISPPSRAMSLEAMA